MPRMLDTSLPGDRRRQSFAQQSYSTPCAIWVTSAVLYIQLETMCSAITKSLHLPEFGRKSKGAVEPAKYRLFFLINKALGE